MSEHARAPKQDSADWSADAIERVPLEVAQAIDAQMWWAHLRRRAAAAPIAEHAQAECHQDPLQSEYEQEQSEAAAALQLAQTYRFTSIRTLTSSACLRRGPADASEDGERHASVEIVARPTGPELPSEEDVGAPASFESTLASTSDRGAEEAFVWVGSRQPHSQSEPWIADARGRAPQKRRYGLLLAVFVLAVAIPLPAVVWLTSTYETGQEGPLSNFSALFQTLPVPDLRVPASSESRAAPDAQKSSKTVQTVDPGPSAPSETIDMSKPNIQTPTTQTPPTTVLDDAHGLVLPNRAAENPGRQQVMDEKQIPSGGSPNPDLAQGAGTMSPLVLEAPLADPAAEPSSQRPRSDTASVPTAPRYEWRLEWSSEATDQESNHQNRPDTNAIDPAAPVLLQAPVPATPRGQNSKSAAIQRSADAEVSAPASAPRTAAVSTHSTAIGLATVERRATRLKASAAKKSAHSSPPSRRSTRAPVTNCWPPVNQFTDPLRSPADCEALAIGSADLKELLAATGLVPDWQSSGKSASRKKAQVAARRDATITPNDIFMQGFRSP